MEQQLFATALVGLFDGEHRTLTLATAGHPPPIVRDKNGVAREFDLTPGPPLGVTTTLNAASRTIQVSSGSAIVMFTDGLVESNHNISSGYGRLIDAASREDIIWSSGAAAKIVETVLDKSPARDDIAVLVLREP